MLERKGELVRLRGQRWIRATDAGCFVGVLRLTRRGDAHVIDEQKGDRMAWIAPESLAGAVHGDRVLVELSAHSAWRRRRGSGLATAPAMLRGRVVRVLDRRRTVTTGILRRGPHDWYAVPLDSRYPSNIGISGFDSPLHGHPPVGAVVEIRLNPWRMGDPRCTGRVTEVLGQTTDLRVQLRACIREVGFPERHSAEAIRESRRFCGPSTFSLDGRRDHRDWPAVTIDPRDARDFDDAVSIRRLSDHHWEVGVHIADVSTCVALDSAMDREARERATSVYLPGRALTMLPPELTTEVCSLAPDIDRPCLTVRALIDDAGRLHTADIYPSIIRSRARLDYESVQAWLVEGRRDAVPPEVHRLLRELEQVTAILRRQRAKAGALLFNLPEVWCEVDSAGHAIDFHRRKAHVAYALIEELMLLANMIVARRLATARVPTIYRIHEPPDTDQWEHMGTALLELGVHMPSADRQGAIAVLHEVEGTSLEYPVAMVVLRHLKRAEYSTRCGVHFGLASRPYTHFTSPIRRYPDLVVHRILRALLVHEEPPYSHAAATEIARHSTAQEQLAEEVERDSLAIVRFDYYQRCMKEGKTGPWTAVVVQRLATGWVLELTDTLQGAFLRDGNENRRLRLGTLLEVELLRTDERRRMLEVRPVSRGSTRPPRNRLASAD